MVEAADQLGFSEQRGIDTLAKDLDYNVVRVFPMIEYIQQRYNTLAIMKVLRKSRIHYIVQ